MFFKNDLPEDIIINLYEYFKYSDLALTATVSRKWAQDSSQELSKLLKIPALTRLHMKLNRSLESIIEQPLDEEKQEKLLVKTVKHFLNLGANAESLAFLVAKAGHVEILRLLHDREIKFDSHLKWYAACYNHPAILEFLYENGYSLDEKCDNYGSTPAHVAAEYGSIEAIYTLGNLGVKFDAKDNKGYTSFQRALTVNCQTTQESLQKRLDVCKALFEVGAPLKNYEDDLLPWFESTMRLMIPSFSSFEGLGFYIETMHYTPDWQIKNLINFKDQVINCLKKYALEQRRQSKVFHAFFKHKTLSRKLSVNIKQKEPIKLEELKKLGMGA